MALRVAMTDIQVVTMQAYYDNIVGFDYDVVMIHSIMHGLDRFGIARSSIGLEYIFLMQSMLTMLTHPHVKPEGMGAKIGTRILSELCMVKEPEEADLIFDSSIELNETGMESYATCLYSH